MKRPFRLWLAIIALSFVLGFLFWVQWGYENTTIVIYDESEELAESLIAPQVASVEEPTTAPAQEIPTWFPVVQWSAIAIASGLVIYVVYLELVYRRKRRSYWQD